MGHDHDRDPTDINPYADQTVANTDAPWLGTGTPVDVDLAGLREYAKHMVDQQTDLIGRSMHLQHLHEMPVQAWEGAVLGEARYVQSQVTANAKELSTYLQNLGNTLMNIGHAAQTVADAYNSADGTSAASLNAVLFAFADPNAERPSGLPSHIGQTYSEWMVANANTTAVAADSPEWGRSTETSTSPYQSTRTSYAPNGQVRMVVTTNIPGSATTVVTTTVYGPGGAVLSTSSARTTSSYNSATNTQTSVVESTAGGNRTGRTETSTTYNNDGEVTREETRSYTTDPKGNDQHTTTRTETVDDDKVRTETTSRPGATPEADPVVTDEVVIGPETDGMTRPQEPLDQAANPMSPGNR